VQVAFQLKQLKYAFYSGTRLKALFVELGESVVHLYWCRDEYVYFVKLKKKKCITYLEAPQFFTCSVT